MSTALRGRRILVTRATRQAGSLAARLRRAGAEVVAVPVIALEPVAETAAVSRAIRELGRYDHLIFTSANAVRALAAAADAAGAGLAKLVAASTTVVAVGPATAAAARRTGLVCDAVPGRHTAAAVAGMLEALDLRGKRVLIPRAQVAGEELPERLRRAGAVVDVLALYRTVPHPDAGREIPRLLGSGLDMVTFTSASTVRSFVAAAGESFQPPAGLAVACIGPVTADAASAAGLEPDVVAGTHTIPGLVAAIRAHYAGMRRTGAA